MKVIAFTIVGAAALATTDALQLKAGAVPVGIQKVEDTRVHFGLPAKFPRSDSSLRKQLGRAAVENAVSREATATNLNYLKSLARQGISFEDAQQTVAEPTSLADVSGQPTIGVSLVELLEQHKAEYNTIARTREAEADAERALTLENIAQNELRLEEEAAAGTTPGLLSDSKAQAARLRQRAITLASKENRSPSSLVPAHGFGSYSVFSTGKTSPVGVPVELEDREPSMRQGLAVESHSKRTLAQLMATKAPRLIQLHAVRADESTSVGSPTNVMDMPGNPSFLDTMRPTHMPKRAI